MEPDIHVLFRRIQLTDEQMKLLLVDTNYLLKDVYMQDSNEA